MWSHLHDCYLQWIYETYKRHSSKDFVVLYEHICVQYILLEDMHLWFSRYTVYEWKTSTLEIHWKPITVTREILKNFWFTYCNMAFVLIAGSSGLKCLYCSTSFSKASCCFCNLSLKAGKVSLIWFVNCWLRILCKYGVPNLSARWR